MTELNRSLLNAFERGADGKEEIDRLLAADAADPLTDVRALLELAETDRLQLLRNRLYDGDVIPHCYHRVTGGRVQGCILFWLTGVTSTAELLARDYPSVEVLRAVCRSIRAWDAGTLTPDVLFEALESVLWVRAGQDVPAEVAPSSDPAWAPG